MGYLVFARKYRPQIFEDVVGQHHVTRTLQNSIKARRVPHALLFAGPRGVGKTSAARILARALNCGPGPTPAPCGQCESCREISSGISMDVIEIDGASNRGINEIRELRENVKYAPARSRHKIFIIDEVHMLTPEAFNALLKTLEEPPDHVIFVFATTEPNKIPITILSRCQRFDFRRISLKEIVQRLQDIVKREGVRISEDNLQSLARHAEGSMRDAQSLLDQLISFAGNEVQDEDVSEVLGVIDRSLLYEISVAVADRNAQRCLEIIDTLIEYGHDIRQFSRDLLNHFRNLMVVHIANTPGILLDLPSNEIEALTEQAKTFDFKRLQQCFNILLQADGDLSHSTFPKLILETALLKVIDTEPVIPIDDILSRLDALEHRLSGPERAPIKPTDFLLSNDPPREGEENSKTPPRKPATPTRSDGSSGPETDPATAENLESTWKEFLKSANRENPILAALLSHGQLIALDGRAIKIAFPKGSFYYERIQEKENKEATTAIIHAFFNRDLEPVFSFIDKRPRRRSTAGKEGETDRQRRIRKEVLEHPIVKDAIEIFEGEIEEIKVEETHLRLK